MVEDPFIGNWKKHWQILLAKSHAMFFQLAILLVHPRLLGSLAGKTSSWLIRTYIPPYGVE